jgi:hypothetical protein
VEKCVESGTNAGSEYVQASATTTKKAFTFKINMCKMQLNATTYRLELITETSKDKKAELEKLFTEAKELATIFNKISRTLKRNEGDTSEKTKKEEEEGDEK